MAEPSRPRPRPRPRPVLKQSSNGSSAATTTSIMTANGIEIINADGTRDLLKVDDTDDNFIRNSRRTAKTWEKLEEKNKEVPKPDRGGSSDEGDSEGHSPRKAKHKRKKEAHHMPLLERSREVSRMLSETLSDKSDDDEDDVTILDGSTTPNGKRKRKARSRSRSITPPPQLGTEQIEMARNIIRNHLNAPARSQSPTYVDPDESTDTIVFNSELQSILQNARKNATRASSQAPAGAAEDHIIVTVKWHPHPLDPKGQPGEWQYKLDRNDTFEELFEATADDACIRTANLIMTYQGKRFSPSVSPQALHIWGDTAQLDGYEKITYEYIQKNPPASQASSAGPSSAAAMAPATATPPPETQESEAEEEAEGDTFKVVLRSAGNKDVSLTVRQTTKCGSILKAFLKKLGIADQYPNVFAEAAAAPAKKGGKKKATPVTNAKDPRLCLDGDKMDNDAEIGEMDLEDGDMIEVVGL